LSPFYRGTSLCAFVHIRCYWLKNSHSPNKLAAIVFWFTSTISHTYSPKLHRKHSCMVSSYARHHRDFSGNPFLCWARQFLAMVANSAAARPYVSPMQGAVYYLLLLQLVEPSCANPHFWSVPLTSLCQYSLPDYAWQCYCLKYMPLTNYCWNSINIQIPSWGNLASNTMHRTTNILCFKLANYLCGL